MLNVGHSHMDCALLLSSMLCVRIKVVPNNWGNGGSRGWPGSPTWSVAYVIIPGHILQYDNDVSLIKTHYSGIKVRTFPTTAQVLLRHTHLVHAHYA